MLSEGPRSIWGCICNDELLKAVNTFGRMCFPHPLPPPPALMHLLHWGVWIIYWEFDLGDFNKLNLLLNLFPHLPVGAGERGERCGLYLWPSDSWLDCDRLSWVLLLGITRSQSCTLTSKAWLGTGCSFFRKDFPQVNLLLLSQLACFSHHCSGSFERAGGLMFLQSLLYLPVTVKENRFISFSRPNTFCTKNLKLFFSDTPGIEQVFSVLKALYSTLKPHLC